MYGCIHRIHYVRPATAHQVDGLPCHGIGSGSRAHPDDLGNVAHVPKEGPRELAGPTHPMKLKACLVKARKTAACTVSNIPCSLFQCLGVYLHTARQTLNQSSEIS